MMRSDESFAISKKSGILLVQMRGKLQMKMHDVPLAQNGEGVNGPFALDPLGARCNFGVRSS